MEQLYHLGTVAIPKPDLLRGRRNADFGQGFYMTREEGFARRWARGGRGRKNFLNSYELDTKGLAVKSFERDREWFEYLYQNRTRAEDALSGVDVIIGPIANDTIYDTQGIITSGFLEKEQALSLLLVGPLYMQVAVKTEKALQRLRWIGAEDIPEEESALYRDLVKKEEEEYQAIFARTLQEILGEDA